mgnify:CR=1 FL=1
MLTSSLHALYLDGVKHVLQSAQIQVEEIEGKTLASYIANDDEFYLIDIREPDQLQRGEIFWDELHKITRGYLEFKIEKAVPNKKALVVIYCCTGKRSILAARSLKEMGYKNVKSLKGGIREWVEDGHILDTAYGEMIVAP